jgi:hypothetical protein
MAYLFTDTYKKAMDVLAKQSFAEPDWKKFLETDCSIKTIFGADGFDTQAAAQLDKVRKKILDSAKHTNSLMVALFGGGPGEVIFNASQNAKSPGKWQDRAAVLELIRCLYRAEAGGAGVWIYSPPAKHTKALFDELNTSDAAAKKKLGLKDEIFSPSERKLMADALSVSRKIVGDTVTKLGAKSDETKAVVKRWFLGAGANDTDVDRVITTLSAGFAKIFVACSATTLVFTDDFDARGTRSSTYGTAMPGGEGGKFPVIYLEGMFMNSGNSGKLWLCAETIIHELSHFELSTKDHRYDDAGLKPGGNRFPASQAIENADSWGYFAVDLAGYLSESDRNRVCA